MMIRQATTEDYPGIYALVKQAFKTAQVSDGKEQDFVTELRQRDTFLPELEFVAEENGELIGHVMLTEQSVDQEDVSGLLLAPLCVAFAYRNQGIGGKLLATALDQAVQLEKQAVFLVGNSEYYARHGFQQVKMFGLENHSEVPDQFVLGRELIPGSLKNVTGRLALH